MRGIETYARHSPATDPADQLAPRIAQAVIGRQQVVSVQLHPAELGSVEIRIVVDANRKVRAIMRADQPETVDLLQRHAGSIERALTATGLTLVEQEALSFDLGTSSGQQGAHDDGTGRTRPGPAARPDHLDLPIHAHAVPTRAASTDLLDLVL
ncbi:MAG TPA: flagellar hook-length control protein FliK [Geminicoccus sp.]|uniref:flagellar hook-length control protein FliK n=1 Tax=Geminicoccus sp. TaxID=2024832 RepID=UPI002E347966|nr:flagellar hook-length control protein FliK [Geminicoccus sp.]HEX2525614.1 flagellar hook-length control protein FliK [Geminicoccus sp.]